MLDFGLLEIEEEAWIKESEAMAKEMEEDRKKLHDELMAYNEAAIEEAAVHFMKKGRCILRGDAENDDSRYFFNLDDVNEVLKRYKGKGGDERKVGVVKVEGMQSAWEIYRIDISQKAEAHLKLAEERKRMKEKVNR